MIQVTEIQLLLLRTINKHDGEWNWYKLGRFCLSKLDSPADFTLRPLLNAGLIQERNVENEPLPRLCITEAGRSILDGSANSVD